MKLLFNEHCDRFYHWLYSVVFISYFPLSLSFDAVVYISCMYIARS